MVNRRWFFSLDPSGPLLGEGKQKGSPYLYAHAGPTGKRGRSLWEGRDGPRAAAAVPLSSMLY